MSLVRRKIENIAGQYRQATPVLGTILSSNPKRHTVTIEYIDSYGTWHLEEDIPVATEPGIWSSGFHVGDIVQIVFQGGNSLAPLVTKRVETEFGKRRFSTWGDPLPLDYPEALDGVD